MYAHLDISLAYVLEYIICIRTVPTWPTCSHAAGYTNASSCIEMLGGWNSPPGNHSGMWGRTPHLWHHRMIESEWFISGGWDYYDYAVCLTKPGLLLNSI